MLLFLLNYLVNIVMYMSNSLCYYVKLLKISRKGDNRMSKEVFKKIVTLLMCLALVLSLVACDGKSGDKTGNQSNNQSENQSDNKTEDNKKPMTAEEVVEKALSAESIDNLKMDMTFKVDMSIDMKKMMMDQGATEDDIQAAIDAGLLTEAYFDMGIAMDVSMTMEGSDDNYYMSGDFSGEFMGQTMTEEIKSYVVKEADDAVTTYTYSAEDKCWYKTTVKAEDEEESELAGILSSIGDYKDYIKSSKIVEQKDGIYTLDVTFDMSKLMNESVTGALDGMLGDLTSSTEGIYDAMKEITMTLKVDEKSGMLTGLHMDFADIISEALKSSSSSSDESETADYTAYMSVKECSLDVKVSNHGNVNVTIPQDVLDNTQESVDDIIFGGDDSIFN